MRHALTALVLGGLTLVCSLAAAGDKKSDKDTKGIVYPISGKDVLWVPKASKSGHQWEVGMAAMDEKNPSQLAFTVIKGKDAELVNKKSGSVDLYTEEKYGDILLEVEFMVPKGSNSGIYLMGEYEVQVLDSFGKADDKLTGGDLGAIYSAAVPKFNAARKPGEWQKFVIDFTAPRFADTKKVTPARFNRVELNGKVIHENVEMKGPTPGGLTGKEHAVGPVMFQGDHGPVAFRNIKISYRQSR